MQKDRDKHRVIPENESFCIWMEAGLISYKLCERKYDCEKCPLDIAMREHYRKAKSVSTTAKNELLDLKEISNCVSNEDYLHIIVNAFFTSLLSQPIPDDRRYSQGHLWVLQEKPNFFTIGIDHIVSYFLKSMREIVLPQVHTILSVDSPCIWIVCREGTVTIHSPLQGEVEKTNLRLIESAHLVNTSPYIDGWMVSISTDESTIPNDIFFGADQARALLINQICSIEKEILTELSKSSPKIGETMFDGGIRAKHLEDIIGSAKFFSILENLVSNRKK